jgi:hypothetical protein
MELGERKLITRPSMRAEIDVRFLFEPQTLERTFRSANQTSFRLAHSDLVNQQ